MDEDLFNYTFPPMNDLIPFTTVPQEVEIAMSHATYIGKDEPPGHVTPPPKFTNSYTKM